MTGTPAKRFWAKVSKSAEPDGCWLWTAAVDSNGYGMFGESPHTVMRAWRWAYEQLVGPPPPGQPDMKCGNTKCVRPDHVEVVSRSEKMRRAYKRQPWDVAKAGRARQEQGCTGT